MNFRFSVAFAVAFGVVAACGTTLRLYREIEAGTFEPDPQCPCACPTSGHISTLVKPTADGVGGWNQWVGIYIDCDGGGGFGCNFCLHVTASIQNTDGTWGLFQEDWYDYSLVCTDFALDNITANLELEPDCNWLIEATLWGYTSYQVDNADADSRLGPAIDWQSIEFTTPGDCNTPDVAKSTKKATQPTRRTRLAGKKVDIVYSQPKRLTHKKGETRRTKDEVTKGEAKKEDDGGFDSENPK